MIPKSLYGFPVKNDVFQRLESIREERGGYDPDHTIRYVVVYDMLSELFANNPSADILILGSGWGALEAVLPAKFRTVSVDVNLEFLIYARSLVSEESSQACRIYIRANLYDVPQLIKKQFDAVLLLEVIEHLRDDVKALEVAHQMLHPQGKIIVSVPNFHRLSNRVKRVIGKGPSYMAPDHVREYTSTQLYSAMHRAGFSNIQILPLSLTFPKDSLIRKLISPWSPIRAMMLRAFPALSTYFLAVGEK